MQVLALSDLQDIKLSIKTEAKSLGFSHIGFTQPDLPLHFDTYLDWVQNGYAANMEYLKRSDAIEKRKNNKLILPECKSIIVFALPYTPALQEEIFQDKPKIAKYAIGDDYHNVIPPLLEKIVQLIKEKVSPYQVEYRIYTDTGPILERDLAQKAGLGWIGKNTCLIIPGTGSFFFLAEILINVPFPSDPMFENDYCGTCTRCLESCPTLCILPNRTIDANRCISYLTIENRGPIPEELKASIDNWVFGCDICQQVCPWNIKFSKDPQPNYFVSDKSILPFDLSSELLIDRTEFKKKYKNSPILRTKYEGFKRNLLIVAANHLQTKMIKALQQFLKWEENQNLRTLASQVLKKIETLETKKIQSKNS